MGSVFLSHSHEDRGFVRKVAADLTVAGVTVWLDEAEIKVGDSLIRKLEEGLSKVTYVAAFLSPSSVASEWVTKELHVALTEEINSRRVIVLPLLIQDCGIPRFLSDKCYIDFRDPGEYDAAFRELPRESGRCERVRGIGRSGCPQSAREGGSRRGRSRWKSGPARAQRVGAHSRRLQDFEARLDRSLNLLLGVSRGDEGGFEL